MDTDADAMVSRIASNSRAKNDKSPKVHSFNERKSKCMTPKPILYYEKHYP